MASTLENLAREVKNAPPRERWAKRQALMRYMKSTTEAAIVSEIKRLEKADVAGQLIGAGLSARAIDALQERVSELNNAR